MTIAIPPKLPYLIRKGLSPVATKRGWEHPVTGELLKVNGGLVNEVGEGQIVRVEFVRPSGGFDLGKALKVVVYYNKLVNVSAGASLVVTGPDGNITLKAGEHLAKNRIVFEFENDGSTPATIDKVGAYSIDEQTISGTITDVEGAVAASVVLTLEDNPADGETVTLNGKTYTFKETLTNTDGYVLIGPTPEMSAENLVAAVNLGYGSPHYTTNPVGTVFAAATTLHATIKAQKLNNTVVFTAKTAGTGGNSLTCSETLTGGSFAESATTLSGGAAAASSDKDIVEEVAGATFELDEGELPDIISIVWDKDEYELGEAPILTVTFDRPVDAPDGCVILVSSTGDDDSFEFFTADGPQENTTEVVFQGPVIDDVPATVNLLYTGAPSNGDTVTIDGKTYTFETELTNADGNVLIDGAVTSWANLVAAITKGPGEGTAYAAATEEHPTVTADQDTGVVIITAKVGGTAGNEIEVSEDLDNAGFEDGATALAGGMDNSGVLSIADQTISVENPIVLTGSEAVANLVISEEVAEAAGTRNIGTVEEE